MSITVMIVYTGVGDSAKEFAKEMMEKGIVDRIRMEEGNERYEYFFPMEDTSSLLLVDRWVNQEAIDIHHKSEMMEEIAQLRKKYKLSMKVQRYGDLET